MKLYQVESVFSYCVCVSEYFLCVIFNVYS